jgi:hypothetical protein
LEVIHFKIASNRGRNGIVRFRAGPLPEEFINALAKHGHMTVRKIRDMFSACIVYEQTGTIVAVGLSKESWLGKSTTGKLEILLYACANRVPTCQT